MSDNNDEDTACVICGGTNSTKKNQIVFCDGGADCNIAVHQKCYGIDVIPDADWLCQRCQDRISVTQTKVICCPKSSSPNGGAFKRTDVPNQYIHVECAIWNKDIDHTKEPFHINTALVGAQKCHICNNTKGLCPQCQYGPGCTNYIHITCAIEQRTFNPRDKDVLVLCGDHLSAPAMSRSPSIGSSSSAVPATRGKRRRVRRVETDDEATDEEEEGDEEEEAEEEEEEDEDEDEEQVTDSDVSMGTTESAKAKSKSKEKEPVKAGVKRPRGRPRKESATSTLKATASNGTKARARPRDDDDDNDDNDSGSDDADLGSRMGDRRAPGVTALASSSTSAIRGKTIPTGAATTAQSSNKLKAMLASKRARKDSGGWQPNAVGPSPAAVGASSSVAPLVLSKSLPAKPPVTASSGASLSQVLPNVAGASVQVASPGAPTLQLQQQPLNTIIAAPLKRPSLAPAPSMVARANMSPNATPLSPGNAAGAGANVPTSTGFKRAGGGMGIGGGAGSGSGASGGPAAALDLDTVSYAVSSNVLFVLSVFIYIIYIT
ncbi:hypothetical protein BC936DRAFT_149782 [Jimgerdemannia flammicorona]|uniref:PHD-type domain-containing protein n=1 Tax=Jimgerdemannia flammicorona TaxID=994334 RepID=A0A433D051_9FUNG|nr:hypothetical protein BC936DRAFT_149782 [Jimgerdemannia flammicorona]